MLASGAALRYASGMTLNRQAKAVPVPQGAVQDFATERKAALGPDLRARFPAEARTWDEAVDLIAFISGASQNNETPGRETVAVCGAGEPAAGKAQPTEVGTEAG